MSYVFLNLFYTIEIVKLKILKLNHFILASVFLASLSILASIKIPSFSILSITPIKFSLFFSAKAYYSRPSTSLQYLSHTSCLSPLAMTSSLTKFSLQSSIAFYRAFKSILSNASISCNTLSFSFL